VRNCFASFVNKVPFCGHRFVLDDPKRAGDIPLLERRRMTYGFSAQADARLTAFVDNNFGSFTVWRALT